MHEIDKANAEALRRLLAGDPVLVDVIPAGEALKGLTARHILHAGPPIGWERMCGPMRGAIMGIAVFEGWASDLKDAAAKAEAGAFRFEPNHHYDAVGPDDRHDDAEPARCSSSRTAPSAIAPTARSTRASAKSCASAATTPRCWPASPGCARCWARRWVARSGKRAASPLKPIVARGLTMGDEMHQRNVACSSLLLRLLAPALARTTKDTEALARCLEFIGRNDQFFLNVAMAMGKAITDPARGIEARPSSRRCAATAPTSASASSGARRAWFTAPVEMPVGLYFPGYSAKDANPDMGDSAIVETVGLGGFAMAAAPGGRRLRRRRTRLPSAGAFTRAMGEITVGSNPEWTIPALDVRRRADRHRHPPRGRDRHRAGHQYRHRPS